MVQVNAGNAEALASILPTKTLPPFIWKPASAAMGTGSALHARAPRTKDRIPQATLDEPKNTAAAHSLKATAACCASSRSRKRYPILTLGAANARCPSDFPTAYLYKSLPTPPLLWGFSAQRAPTRLSCVPGIVHFYPRSEWLRLGRDVGLEVERERRMTPFIRVFVHRVKAQNVPA